MAAGSAPRLFFVRHGETDWNVEGRLQGRQDIPLNGVGREQSARAGRKLKDLLASAGLRPEETPFQSSPLGRARETLEIARRAMGLHGEGCAFDDRLLEFTFGRWEGLTWPEVCARDPDLAAARAADKWNFCPPGGESYAQLAERLAPWLAEQDRPSVVVSHGGVARALMRMIGSLSEQRAPVVNVWQGRVLVFSRDRFDWV
ncbi:histidine phosphatase family protein [Rhodoblastus sp.]|uniref:histidine phosphatase family protein n=1 Tax=Rhodoblastus sp. TaxID=1962975 RepID=UPI0026018DC4|nr:histidine phosphatase family protein [Rhodoblastus sp.]